MLRSVRARLSLAVAVSGLFMVATTSLVLGYHSATSPREFFDLNNNGIAENSDSIIGYQRRGTWASDKISRVTEAMASWSANTDWNPFSTSTAQVQDMWIDGGTPQAHGSPCASNQDTWVELGGGDPTAVYAVNCLYRSWHQTGSGAEDGYWRNQDSDILLNSSNVTFSWLTTDTAGLPSARGVLTHEIGHGATLADIYTSCGSPMATMCGAVSDSQTWNLYTLTTDDINSASVMY